ncbi:MAG TPA: hypothetical protein VGM53_33565 [Streptosporangiaceae bacterium]|jgi:hypothetical protein
MNKRYRPLLIGVGLIGGGTIAGRLLGYNMGGKVVVRCRQGHLYTTIWIPGVKLKAVDLGVARIQYCPVGKHWSLVTPVRDSALTDAELQSAHEHHDTWLP